MYAYAGNQRDVLVERIALPAAENIFTLFIITLNHAGQKRQTVCAAIIFKDRVFHKLELKAAPKEEACEHIHALRNQYPAIRRARIDGRLNSQCVIRFAVTLCAERADV